MAKDLYGLVSLPFSNLYLTGFGLDTNGNSVVRLRFPNQRGFSLQTNGVLKETHSIGKSLGKKGIEGLTAKQLKDIEKECVGFIKSYGTPLQKKKLRIYSK
jgi:hypothetical protein